MGTRHLEILETRDPRIILVSGAALVGGFVFYPASLVVFTKLLHAGPPPIWRACNFRLGSLVLGLFFIAFHLGSFRSAALLIALLIVFAGLSTYDFSKASSTTRYAPWGIDPPSLTRTGWGRVKCG